MLLDEETLKKSSIIDPQVVEFAKNNPSPPLDWKNPSAVKAIIAEGSRRGLAMIGQPEASLVEEYRNIPMRDGFQSSIKVHKPATAPPGGSPLIIFCYGGGFIGGDNNTGTAYGRAWARLFGAVTVSISYRLAPEYKFPFSQYDAIDSAKWIAEHASQLGADPTKGFIVGGISAGAQLTAVIVNASFTDGLKYPITGQWLAVPGIMDEVSVPDKYKKYYLARKHNVDVPILPASALDDLKVHVEWDEKSPLRYPILSDVPLSKLPPAYLQADGLDPLRDDALIYDEMLKEAGVKTKIDFYPGCPHAHFAIMPGMEISNKATVDIFVGMGWLLGKSVSPEEGLKAMLPVTS